MVSILRRGEQHYQGGRKWFPRIVYTFEVYAVASEREELADWCYANGLDLWHHNDSRQDLNVCEVRAPTAKLADRFQAHWLNPKPETSFTEPKTFANSLAAIDAWAAEEILNRQ